MQHCISSVNWVCAKLGQEPQCNQTCKTSLPDIIRGSDKIQSFRTEFILERAVLFQQFLFHFTRRFSTPHLFSRRTGSIAAVAVAGGAIYLFIFPWFLQNCVACRAAANFMSACWVLPCFQRGRCKCKGQGKPRSCASFLSPPLRKRQALFKLETSSMFSSVAFKYGYWACWSNLQLEEVVFIWAEEMCFSDKPRSSSGVKII